MKVLITVLMTIISFCSYGQLSELELKSKLVNKTWVFEGLNGEYEKKYTNEEVIFYFRGEETGRLRYHTNRVTCNFNPDKVGQASAEIVNFYVSESGGCFIIQFLNESKFRILSITHAPLTIGWKYYILKE